MWFNVRMSWATRRRFIIVFILGAIILAFATVLLISTIYQAPSCVDRLQNQDETGVDCGGACAYLCTEQMLPPTVLFTKAISNGAGRIDVIASIENRNATAAAKGVPYRVQLFGADGIMVREVTGTVDLPPATTVPVFIAGLASDKQTLANTFLEIEPSAPRWFTLDPDPRIVPVVSNTALVGTSATPRVQATLGNPTATILSNVRVVVLVRNVQGNVIGISSTVIPTIAAQGQATATFTWNGAFSGVPTAIEVIPVIPLP